MKKTFEELRAVAIHNVAEIEHGGPASDVGFAAVIVADALFGWIAANISDPKQRADVAAHVAAALGLEDQ